MKKMTLLLLVALLVSNLTSCTGNISSKSNESSSSKQVSSIVEQSSQEESSSEEEEEDDNTNFKMKDVQKIGNWEVKITKAKVKNNIPNGYTTFIPDKGSKFVEISATVTNKGKKSIRFLPQIAFASDISCKLVYGDENEYLSTILLAYGKDLHTNIESEGDKSGIIVFSVPKKITSSKKSISLIFSLDGKTYSCPIKISK